MGLTRLAIARPVAVLMLIGAFVVLGFLAFFTLPEELNPNVDFPLVTVTTTYTGTSPNDMETLITKPIEDSISGVSGIKQINSTSQEGISVVSIQFFFGTDLNEADADVIQKVDAIRKLLPVQSDAPAVIKADTSSQPVIYYAMQSKTISPRDLRSLAQNVVVQAMEQAPGVGGVTITGGDVREIHVDVYPDRLASYGCTTSDLANALNNANITVSSGFIQKGNVYDEVRLFGEFSSVKEIQNLRLNVNGHSFNLSDVADVRDTIQEETTQSMVNGVNSVTLVVQKTSDGNTVEAADGVRAAVARIQKHLPPGITFTPVIDLSTIVKSNVNDVRTSLILGSILAVLVVFMFLHNVRGTFIIAIAIPTSIISTFFPIAAFGFTLNTMTLLGLSLAVGILVDDSIVVLENINRHLTLGEEPTVAAINGRTEIGLAAITLTAVDLVVFLPIGFMGGVIGEFFRSFGITVAVATSFSLLVSFTLTPMLASRWYKKGDKFEFTHGFAGAFDRGFARFELFYQRMLRSVMTHPYISFAVGGLILVFFAWVSFGPLHLGFRFAPDQDQDQVSIRIEGPPGASITYTEALCDRIYQVIRSTPDLSHDVQYVFTDVGHSQTGGTGAGLTGTEYANIALQLYDRRSALDIFNRAHLRNRSDKDVATEVRQLTRDIAGAQIYVQAVSGFQGNTAPIQVNLTGTDFNDLLSAAAKVEDLIRRTPGAYDPDISFKNSQPEVQIRLDRVKASDFGLSLLQVGNAVADSIGGNIVPEYRDPNDGEEYYIRVEYPWTYRNDPAQVGNVIVGYQNGTPVLLSQVANISMGAGPVKIDRLNRERTVSVTGYLKPGYVIGNVSVGINKALAKMDLGRVSYQFGGEAQSLSDEGGYLAVALALGIILSYMLMAALFNNALYPFAIMLSLPQAWAGAFFALAITGQSLNLIAMIGFVLLNGVVNKNAILVVDFTNTLRRRGYRMLDALAEAGPTRLRPILMTTIAIVVTSLPTALALGRGAGFRQSLGITVIGGASLSLFLSLLIVPCAYIMWDDFAHPSRLWRRFFRDGRGGARPIYAGGGPRTDGSAPTDELTGAGALTHGNGSGNGHGNGLADGEDLVLPEDETAGDARH